MKINAPFSWVTLPPFLGAPCPLFLGHPATFSWGELSDVYVLKAFFLVSRRTGNEWRSSLSLSSPSTERDKNDIHQIGWFWPLGFLMRKTVGIGIQMHRDGDVPNVRTARMKKIFQICFFFCYRVRFGWRLCHQATLHHLLQAQRSKCKSDEIQLRLWRHRLLPHHAQHSNRHKLRYNISKTTFLEKKSLKWQSQSVNPCPSEGMLFKAQTTAKRHIAIFITYICKTH